MINLKRVSGFMATFVFCSSVFALSSADIANNCRPYLVKYGNNGNIPAKEAKQAAAALSLCVANNSCSTNYLTDITHCGRKLSNLALSAQIAGIKTKGQQNTSLQPLRTAPVTTPETTEEQPNIQPETESLPQTTPTNQPDKQPKKDQPKINWF